MSDPSRGFGHEDPEGTTDPYENRAYGGYENLPALRASVARDAELRERLARARQEQTPAQAARTSRKLAATEILLWIVLAALTAFFTWFAWHAGTQYAWDLTHTQYDFGFPQGLTVTKEPMSDSAHWAGTALTFIVCSLASVFTGWRYAKYVNRTLEKAADLARRSPNS